MDPQELSTNPSNAKEVPTFIENLYSGLSITKIDNFNKGLGRVLQLCSGTFPSWFNGEGVNLKKEVFIDNMAKLKAKMDNIPEEKVCEVPPEVGVPIIEKLTYVTNDQIRNAYMNLLAKASSEDTANVAHPSFEGLISRLSADEARIIEFLKGKSELNFIHMKLETKGNGWFYRKKFATGLEFDISLDFPDNIEAYTFNLITMGIFAFTAGNHKVGENVYEPLISRYEPYKKSLDEEIESQMNVFNIDMTKLPANIPVEVQSMLKEFGESQFTHVTTEKGNFDITPFGRLFIRACTE